MIFEYVNIVPGNPAGRCRRLGVNILLSAAEIKSSLPPTRAETLRHCLS
jgi:hypothetical protein